MYKRILTIAIGILFSITGCGKAEKNEIKIEDNSSPGGTTIVASALLKADDTECDAGGVKIDSGIDTNNNGTLDASEIDVSKIVCHGTPGVNSLVKITDEPASGNCATGGKKITTGMDANRNDELDSDEVKDTQYVCNGANGTDGKDGVDGIDGLNGLDGKDGVDATTQAVCSVSDNNDGTKTLSCPDGSSVTISNGQNGIAGEPGQNGVNGSSCSVADNGNGSKTISCTDGSSATLNDGTNGQDGSSCSIADNGDGSKTISCTDGTSATIHDGVNGTNNRSIASIHCGGYLEGYPTIWYEYSAHQLSSGDVIVTASMKNSYIESSQTKYYSFYQVGFLTAAVLISFDMYDTSNGGWWRLELDRETLIVSASYNDVEQPVNPQVWAQNPDNCLKNTY